MLAQENRAKGICYVKVCAQARMYRKAKVAAKGL